MNKQVEQIRSEIERLKAIADYQLDNCKVDKSAWRQQAEVCKKLLSFIGSDLEPDLTQSVTKISDQEPEEYKGILGEQLKYIDNEIQRLEKLKEEPANEDLEKEIDRWSQEHSYNKSEKPVFAAVARHFAKWQKEIDKLIFYNDLSEFEDIKKLVVNEIASINTIETIDTDFDGWYNRLIVFAKRCAQWQKQQMMKNTVDAVAEKPLAIADGCEDAVRFEVVGDEFAQGFKSGDKVKIIIIKEDKI